MIELVFLGSLILLALHFLTSGTSTAPVRKGKKRGKPRRSAPRIPRIESASADKMAVEDTEAVPDITSDPLDGDYEFEVVYTDESGVETAHRIAWVSHEATGGETLIRGYCSRAKGQIALKNSNITSCRNLRSGRSIKDLGRYCRTRATKR